MRLRTLAFTAALFIAFTGQARAVVLIEPKPLAAPELSYLNIARDYWRHKPSYCKRMIIRTASRIYYEGEESLGLAKGVPSFPVPWPCFLYVQRDDITPVEMCLVFVHEWGHVLGRDDVYDDPTNVMSGELDPEALPYVARCYGQEPAHSYKPRQYLRFGEPIG